MADFAPSQVTFGDLPGYGMWDMGHAREHMRMVQVLQARDPPILVPDYDFLAMISGGPTVRESLDSHQSVHGILRQVAGITGVDYTDFMLDDQTEFYSFLAFHEQEHQQLRAAFGIT